MGNYRFRLSDMMPNAWFYKLRDMGQGSKRNSAKNPSFSQQKHPHCLAAESSVAGSVYSRRISDAIFVETLLKPSRTGEKRRTIYRPSPVSADISSPVSDGRDSFHSPNYLFLSSVEGSSLDEQASWASSCSCRISSSTSDIIIDMNDVTPGRRKDQSNGYKWISEMELPPILTKPVRAEEDAIEGSSSSFEERKSNTLSRKPSANVAGVRLRARSPKLPGKKIRARNGAASIASFHTKNRSHRLSESCAIVKSSVDPRRDFRESMVEMIVEHNIRASKDLEHLQACYLSLNSDELRHIIIEAFEQTWFDFIFKNGS